jgi:heptosyltransferase I
VNRLPEAITTQADNSALKIDRLLIVRLSSMGDILHSLPAAAALSNAFPDATLGWVVEQRWAELLCTVPTPRSGPRSRQRPLVDRIHLLDTKNWRTALLSTQTWERIAASLSDLRAGEYQVAVDLQGAARSGIIARWSGAPTVYGAAQPRENVASMFYTHQVIAVGAHVIQQNIAIAEAVAGRALEVPEAQLPHDPQADGWLKSLGIKEFVLLSPGAGWGAKHWPPEHYGSVAKTLSEAGVAVLINFGPGEEGLARRVASSSGNRARALETTLTQLIALTRRAQLFIGGDSGPMHLAATLRIPVVAVFGPTDPARNGPFGTRSIVLRGSSSVTSHKRRSVPDRGLLEISPEQVVEAARQLLGKAGG